MAVLEVNGLKKIYTTRFGGNRVQALTNVSFAVERGEYVAIMGESGSGKTTLLNILAALDRPTQGEVWLNGRALSSVGEKGDRRVPPAEPRLRVSGFQPARHVFFAGQHLPAARARGQALPGDEPAPAPDRRSSAFRIFSRNTPYEGLRRPEAARRRGPRTDHIAADHPRG